MRGRRRDRPFWYLRRKRHELQADVDEEFRAHLEMRVEELTSEQSLDDGEWHQVDMDLSAPILVAAGS